MMEFFKRPVFTISGFTFTVGMVVAVAVIVWYVKFRK